MEKVTVVEKFTRSKAYSFTNLLPGGNGTALISGVVRDQPQRKRINDSILRLYPDLIEQVGFIDIQDPENCELMMAGGEFCGNATRSTAYLALSGQPGEVSIKVSGVEKKLRAGVYQNGEAFAQMPIYPETDRVERDVNNPNASTIYMEGITQYVLWDDPNIKGKNPKEMKAYAYNLLKEKGYDTNYPAAGVMFVEKTSKGIEMKPVVYVRDTDTLYYETACGSGTTAVGLVLAKEKEESITEMPIYQPSGLPIKVTVNYDEQSKEFTYAEISGPVNTVGTGMMVEAPKGTYVTEQIKSMQQLEVALEKQNLIGAYDVFKDPPYNEQFTDEEVRKTFGSYVQKGMLFVARTAEQVIGFGATVPLSEEGEIAQLAQTFGISPENAWYMADLGVTKDRREEKIALQLTLIRLDATPEGATIIMRTSVGNEKSQKLYKEWLGFQQIKGMVQNVKQKRTDGTIETDPRIFLFQLGSN